jgi:pimeloyl-ACP methyl ester carboxylesterase
MLKHGASYGCVCVAPDLSWLPGGFPRHTPQSLDAFNLRATVLVEYYNYLIRLNATLFAGQLDLSRVVLVGHSTGGGAATRAGYILSPFLNLQSLCYGLIAPVPDTATPDVRNLLVLHGVLDTQQGADPLGAYASGGTPKTLLTIPGANHFGYTSLCNDANICDSYISDAPGTIWRADQQAAGAAYLAALVRYYALGDVSARVYLAGERVVEGLETLNLQVQAAGYLSLRPTFSPIAKP